jgi:long-chain acyl-CoA synthetase
LPDAPGQPEPRTTARILIDGWLHTGDLGYVDDDGFFFVVNRKDDLIIRGGYDVYQVPSRRRGVRHRQRRLRPVRRAPEGRAEEVVTI